MQDLAARNILVDEKGICKISDFGMSRELKVDDTYDTQVLWIPYIASFITLSSIHHFVKLGGFVKFKV